MTVHSSASDSATISEVERRERTQVQSDAVALEDEPASMSRLQAMVRSAEAGDGGAALNKVVAAEPEGTLSRLLYSGADISSVTVDAEPSTVHAIATVRGVLNAALERAVCGSNAAQPSDRLIRALGAIRLRRLTRVRLCHLLDLDDRGTAISPLAEFAHMSSSDAITNFTMALQRMQTAWVFAAPSHAAQAMMFVSALQRECLKALTAGSTWEEIGNYYGAVIRRADRIQYPTRWTPTQVRNPPSLSICPPIQYPTRWTPTQFRNPPLCPYATHTIPNQMDTNSIPQPA